MARSMTAMEKANSRTTTERELNELWDYAQDCRALYRPLSAQQRVGLDRLQAAIRRALGRIVDAKCEGK